MQFMKPFARLHRSDSDDHQALWLAILVDVDRHCLGKIERAAGDGMRHLPDHPVISLDSGNPSTPPIRMRSPLRMVANGVSDTIATLSVWLSPPLQWRSLMTSPCFLIFSSSIRLGSLLNPSINVRISIRRFCAMVIKAATATAAPKKSYNLHRALT
jgi:hypothetical protein